MPDWKKLVRDQMPLREMAQRTREEVISEIAAHLEDASEDSSLLDSFGERTSPEFLNVHWKNLGRAIECAKRKEEIMNDRSRSLWLPAFINIVVAATLLIIFDIIYPHPVILRISNVKLVIPILWLLTLPICGATGALLACRAHGSTTIRMIAGLAPSLVWLAAFCIMGVAFALDWRVFHGFPMNDFFMSAVAWVALPALCLLPGALPFLRRPAQD
jgi:hypothetical protein